MCVCSVIISECVLLDADQCCLASVVLVIRREYCLTRTHAGTLGYVVTASLIVTSPRQTISCTFSDRTLPAVTNLVIPLRVFHGTTRAPVTMLTRVPPLSISMILTRRTFSTIYNMKIHQYRKYKV